MLLRRRRPLALKSLVIIGLEPLHLALRRLFISPSSRLSAYYHLHVSCHHRAIALMSYHHVTLISSQIEQFTSVLT